jgi:hypothetical protein
MGNKITGSNRENNRRITEKITGITGKLYFCKVLNTSMLKNYSLLLTGNNRKKAV